MENLYNKYEHWYNILCEYIEQNDSNFYNLNSVFKEIYDNSILYDYEVNFGNYILSEDIISVIYDGKLKHYELEDVKAKEGDIILIKKTDKHLAIPNFTKGKFYKVSKVPSKCDIISSHVVVGTYAVYDEQYLVLREL